MMANRGSAETRTCHDCSKDAVRTYTDLTVPDIPHYMRVTVHVCEDCYWKRCEEGWSRRVERGK